MTSPHRSWRHTTARSRAERSTASSFGRSRAGCAAGLGEAADAGLGWAQVWDIPPISLQKVHYLLPRRRCGCCGKTTTAPPPFGAAGTVSYGPNVNAAAILLGIEGNVPVERTAMVMAVLLGAPVSTGFVARALARFAQRLTAAGFDEAMKTALRAEDVLCADETPTNVIHKDTDEQGEPCLLYTSDAADE